VSERAKRRARDAPFGDVGSACVDIRPPSKTDVLVSIFHDGGRPPYWIFLKFEFLTFGTSQRANLRYLAKFLAIQSNRCGDIAFLSFQDGGRPPSSITYTTVWTTHEEHLVVFVTVQNLVGISGVVSVFVRSFFAVRGPAC